MADDGGVLGNLPNSRPGKRSAKRDSAARAAAKAEADGRPAAKRPRSPKAARTSAKPGAKAAGAASPKAGSRARAASPRGPAASSRAAARPSVEEVPLPASEDPVGAAVRTAAGLAAAGVKVTGAVTRELLRRLPRP